MPDSLVERYLRLGLQLGRHVEGIVDAYYGPPELAAAVDAEPPVDPRRLVSAAEALLDEVEDGWLGDQVAGLRTFAGVLAGEPRSYADEVEGCYRAWECVGLFDLIDRFERELGPAARLSSERQAQPADRRIEAAPRPR